MRLIITTDAFRKPYIGVTGQALTAAMVVCRCMLVIVIGDLFKD